MSAERAFEISLAGVADVPLLALVASACAVNNYSDLGPPEDLVQFIEDYHSRRFFAERMADARCSIRLARLPSAGVAGYMMIYRPPLAVTNEPHELEVARLHVLPRYRGRGIGAELFEYAIGDARDFGASRLVVGCDAGNDRARAFYEQRGFVVAGERAFVVGRSRYLDLAMVKVLDD